METKSVHALTLEIFTYDPHAHQGSAHLHQNQGYKSLEEPIKQRNKVVRSFS